MSKPITAFLHAKLGSADLVSVAKSNAPIEPINMIMPAIAIRYIITLPSVIRIYAIISDAECLIVLTPLNIVGGYQMIAPLICQQ